MSGQHASITERCWINPIVLCEVIWVLKRSYRYVREQIATTVELLLAADGIRIEDGIVVRSALHVYRVSQAGPDRHVERACRLRAHRGL